MVNVSASPSTSVAASVMASASSSSVVTPAAVAMGASLMGATVSEMVATSLSAVPSLTLKVNVSSPLKSASGT